MPDRMVDLEEEQPSTTILRSKCEIALKPDRKVMRDVKWKKYIKNNNNKKGEKVN